MSPPDRLYHYTSPTGLIGIVEHKALWATSLWYLNDDEELLAGVDACKAYLDDRLAATKDGTQRDRLSALQQDLRGLSDSFSIMHVFVASLTPNGNQLSQWRAYCRGGGFSIGFPTDELQAAAESQGFILQKCVYTPDRQNELIGNAVDPLIDEWVQSAALPLNVDHERHVVSAKLQWKLLCTAARVKNASFDEEEETRIVSRPERQLLDAEPLFRAGRGFVIPYVTVRLPNTRDFWKQVHIVVGPSPRARVSKTSVHDLLRRACDATVMITESGSSFRE